MKLGIDLGTTNSALAFIDPREAESSEFPPVHILDIPQPVSASTSEPRRTLPSFLYLEGDGHVGEFAREQGALVPTKLVHSAKSWLSNSEVDRRAKILPWDAQEQGRVMSPVEASARYLAHLRQAWESSGRAPASDQDIVLTVPASFDEEARELTVEAAAEAGFPKVTLLEEPAAAFYSWIATICAVPEEPLRRHDVLAATSAADQRLHPHPRPRETTVSNSPHRRRQTLLLGGGQLDLTLGGSSNPNCLRGCRSGNGAPYAACARPPRKPAFVVHS